MRNMKYIFLALVGGLAAIIATAMAQAPAGVMSMSQAERAQAHAVKVAAERQERYDRNARLLCAQRLGIPHNNEWSVQVKGGKYIVQGGMCRMAAEVVE